MGERSEPGAGGPVEAVDDDAALDTPNCPVCLHRMEATDTASGDVYWACSACGQTRIG